MIYSIEFIFLRRIIPDTCINNNLGLLTLAVFLFVVYIFLIGNADFAGCIKREILFRKNGLFDKIHPFCIGIVCGSPETIRRTVIREVYFQRVSVCCKAVLSAVCITSGDYLNQAVFAAAGLIGQYNVPAVDCKIFFQSVYCSCNIVPVLVIAVERPLCNITVGCDKQNSFIIQNIRPHEHIVRRQTLDTALRFCLCRQCCRCRRIVVICNAIGFSVQMIRIPLYLIEVLQFHSGVDIIRIIICRDRLSVHSALHVPAEVIRTDQQEIVCCSRKQSGCKHGCLRFVRNQRQAVGGLLYVSGCTGIGIFAEGIKLVCRAFHLFKIVQNGTCRYIGRRCFRCFRYACTDV